MAGRTVRQSLDVVRQHQLFTEFGLRLAVLGLGVEAHRVDVFSRAQVLLRIAVAIDAPAHVERVLFPHQRHLVDAAVAAFAAHALLHVHRVVEVDELRQVMQAHPRNGLVLRVAIADDLQHFGVGPDLRVARHAGLRRRNACARGDVHTGVAIAAIDAEALHVVIVAELVAATEGLGKRISLAQRFLRTDEIFLGLIVIGLIGLAIDLSFRLLMRRTCSWAN